MHDVSGPGYMEIVINGMGSVIKIPGACQSGGILCGAKHVSHSMNTVLNSIGSSPCVVLTYLKDFPGI